MITGVKLEFDPRLLQSEELLALLTVACERAVAEYRALAPHRTGRLAASAGYRVEVAQPYSRADPRLVGIVTVGAPYALPVEFGHGGPAPAAAADTLRQILETWRI